MLELAVGLLVIAVIAGALGFTGLARGAANMAKAIFIFALVIGGAILLIGFLGIAAIF